MPLLKARDRVFKPALGCFNSFDSRGLSRYISKFSAMPGGVMVAPQVLDLLVGVRIPTGQPFCK